MNRDLFLKLLMLLLLASAGLFYGLILPEKKKSENYVQKIQEATELFQMVESRKELYHERNKQIQRFLDILPPQEDLPILNRDITALADRNGITWSTISFKSPVNITDDIVFVEFVLPVSGEYNRLRHFIAEVENIRDIVNIESISNLSAQEGQKIRLDIRMKTYFQRRKS